MKRWYALCFSVLVLAVTGIGHATVTHTTLDNGLTVVVEENHANPVVSVYVFVRTGSIHEQEYLGSGMSHFFEHIISGGTTSTRNEAESRTLMETIGNNSNAYTTTDHTAYYINTTAEHWTTALGLLSDWMLNSVITDEEFQREKGVVQRELEQGLDNPRRQLFQLLGETQYKVHPARLPVIGYKPLVQKVSRDDLLTYYQRMYAPNNMVLVVVGDVETSSALAHIRKAFAGGVRRSVPAITLPEEPPQVGKRTAEKDMDIAQAHMALAFRTVLLTHPDLYPLDVLSYILSNGDSSRLVKRIKDDKQLVYSIRSSSYTPSYAPGNMTVWATLEPEQLEAAQQAILAELYRLRDELVSPEELAKAKKQKIAEHVFGRQTAQQRARALGIDILSTHDPHFSDTYVKNIQRVTAEEIQRVARQYFHEHQLNIAVVRPKRSETQATAAEQNTQQRTAMVKKTLDNGITLLLQRNPALPIVSLQAYFNAGVRVETPETNGLTQLMARLLVKGTTSRSADDIATTFDAMGGELSSGSGNNSFFVTASSLAEDLSTALDIFADVIMHPTFPEEELEKMRRLMLAALQRQNDSWQAEVRRLFRATHYTTSPYRLLPDGSSEALPKLTRQDVMDVHTWYAVPNNMVLAIVGDIDVDRTAALIAQAFADFRQRPLAFPDVPAEPAHTATRRKVKETTKQVAAIYVGFPGTMLSNVQDRYPLHILDAILSGIGFPGGWLHTELRGQQLVYVVHAFNWLGLDPGYFGIIAATQPPKAQEVIDIILQKVEQAKAGKFGDDELERAKRLAVIAARLRRQSNSDIASDAAINELFLLGYGFSRDETKRLNAVTRAEVQRVARTYLNHPTIVLTTPTP